MTRRSRGAWLASSRRCGWGNNCERDPLSRSTTCADSARVLPTLTRRVSPGTTIKFWAPWRGLGRWRKDHPRPKHPPRRRGGGKQRRRGAEHPGAKQARLLPDSSNPTRTNPTWTTQEERQAPTSSTTVRGFMRHRQGPRSEQRRVTQMDDWVQQNGPFTGHATASPSGWRFRFHTRMPRPCHSAISPVWA